MEHQHTNTQILKHSLGTFILSLLLAFLCACSTGRAQTYTIDNNKSIKLFEKAQAMYQASNFPEAEKLLKQALEREPDFVEANTLLGYVYLDKGQYVEAKKQFAHAIKVNPTAIPNNLFFLAELEMKDGEYEKAQKLYQTFLNARNVNPDMLEKSNSSLDQIHFALQAKTNPVKFEPKNLGPNVNSEHAEYFPCITVDENTLLYTRRLPFEASPQGYNEDFFVAERKEGGEWQKAYNIQRPINTEFNEGAPTLSPDGQILIFTACELYGDYGGRRRGHGSCDLFYASKNGKNWTNPINLGTTINSKHWETQPSYSADGRTLFFVRGIRNRSGNRQGDIYTSTLTEDSYWTKPEKLNKNINTPFNEESVFIHPDGKTLYFSSNGHQGLGGLDIFVSKKENGEWGKAINLGYPINTHKNENSLLVSADGKTAYFASDREDGYGDLDLYSFDLDESIAPEKVTYFAGKIYDVKTQKPLSARFQLLDLESGELIVESFSNNNGEFLITLPSGKNYALNASKDNYLFYSENFALKESKDNGPVKRDVPLQPIEIGQKIVLKNIFFESAKYDLKESSKVELDKLADFLKKNPQLKIEIGGHTDNVGNPADNLKLSKNRAKAVSDYLIKSEIAASRMRSTGYGPTKPIESNDTEAGRAKNRRTEFEIVGM